MDPEAGLRLHNPQGITEPLGQIGPVTASYVCLRTHEGLVGARTVSMTGDRPSRPRSAVSVWAASRSEAEHGGRPGASVSMVTAIGVSDNAYP